MDKLVDNVAKEFAIRGSGLTADLHIPIAARNEEIIGKYIGNISKIFSKSSNSNALLVEVNDVVIKNPVLKVWDLKESEVFHATKQVWVHVNYLNYRKAYFEIFPDTDKRMVIDHIYNRRMLRLAYYDFVRLTPVHRGVNSNHGAISEKYGVEYFSSPAKQKLLKEDKSVIKYADISDLVKMLNIKSGGKIQEGLNEMLDYFLVKKK